MTIHDPQRIRSFALVGHGGCGKTSIADGIAFLTGSTPVHGSVAAHNSVFDYEDEEKKREGSVSTTFASVEYDGYRIHVADTPGDGNYLHEARVAVNAVDSVVLVISAVDGVEVSTEQMSAHAKVMDRPQAVFINKMDREYADIESVMADLRGTLGLKPVQLQIPIGTESSFRGVVDLLNRKALIYDGTSCVPTEGEIPDELAEQVDVAIEAMMETVAEVDDELLEEYLETLELSQDQLRAGLNKGIRSGELCPVLLGSATHNVGLDRLLWLSRALPSAEERGPVEVHRPDDPETPLERTADPDGPLTMLCIKTYIDLFAGQISVFRVISGTVTPADSPVNARSEVHERLGNLMSLCGKEHTKIDAAVPGDIVGAAKLKDTETGDTLCDPKDVVVAPFVGAPPAMMSYTIKPKTRKDVDKLKFALQRLLAEDVGLRQSYDIVTKELVLAGMGQAHVALSVDKLLRKYGVAVDLGTPAIPYRETITGRADVLYRHKKQTGGAGQFGQVSIRMYPSPRGEGFKFVNAIVGGSIPGALIPSVEKGVRDKLTQGVLAGFPVEDVTVELYDGKYHPVDSKDIAFQIAGRQAVKKAVMESRPVLLEPIYRVDVVVPEDHVGDVMGDMNSRRGRILSMDTRGRNSVVKALVPLAEIMSYSPELRSMTGGKGTYTMEFSTYEQVPPHMQDKLVAELHRLEEEED